MMQGRSWNIAIMLGVMVVGGAAVNASAAEVVGPINPQLGAGDFDVPSLPFEDNTPWPIFCPPDELPPAVNPPPVEVPNRPPTMAAPLPPALISGGLLLVGNGVLLVFRKRRI